MFRDRAAYEDTERISGVVVYRFEAPLIYANAGAFAYGARALVDAADPAGRILVIDCEVMFEIDYTGVKAIEGLIEDMHERGLDVRLARAHPQVLERLRVSGAMETLGEDHVYPRVENATDRSPVTVLPPPTPRSTPGKGARGTRRRQRF